MRAWVALAVVVMLGCSQAQPSAATTLPPTPTAGETPTASDTVCRLPVTTRDATDHIHGGFLTFPGGRLSMDPGGDGAAYYDRVFSRWLPVDAKAVDAAGAHYAYLDRKVPGTSAPVVLHVVDIPTGTEQTYQLTPNGDVAAYVVIAFAPQGIWLSYAGYESPRGGLFQFDPAAGVLKDVGGKRQIFDPVAGGSGVFWFTDAGPNPQQSSGMGGILPARVNRLTVSDGSAEAWFTKDGSYLSVLGTDLAGHPIVTDGNNVWLAVAPNQVDLMRLPESYYTVYTDSHGVWLGGDKGLYLYTPSGETVQVSTQAMVPAGSCV